MLPGEVCLQSPAGFERCDGLSILGEGWQLIPPEKTEKVKDFKSDYLPPGKGTNNKASLM